MTKYGIFGHKSSIKVYTFLWGSSVALFPIMYLLLIYVYDRNILRDNIIIFTLRLENGAHTLAASSKTRKSKGK